MRGSIMLVAFAAGCGRLGFDDPPRQEPDAALTIRDAPPMQPDSPPPVDAAVDTGMVPICRPGLTPIPGTAACIELAERAGETWVSATATCAATGGRLCTDLEWATACTAATGLADMTNDWEWVAEEAAGVAQKRGGAGMCTDMSTHEIDTDPYSFRCCE